MESPLVPPTAEFCDSHPETTHSDVLPEEVMSERDKLFEFISSKVTDEITTDFILTTKTLKGNTQNSERIVIAKIRDILMKLDISFQEAGSQQSKDFRNVGGIGLDIEVKKTDSFMVYFNDTCPTPDIYYIVIYTGKRYKNKKKSDIDPRLICLNGNEFIKNDQWIKDYIRDIEAVKNKYARGMNKKLLSVIMEVYPRPTFKANISKFVLGWSGTEVVESKEEMSNVLVESDEESVENN